MSVSKDNHCKYLSDLGAQTNLSTDISMNSVTVKNIDISVKNDAEHKDNINKMISVCCNSAMLVSRFLSDRFQEMC